MTDIAKRKHVVIVGGGVIGLSIAISLLDHPVEPYAVTIVAEDLPDLDQKTYSPSWHGQGQAAPAAYASAWAGAHHVSDAQTEVGRRRDETTFKTLCKLDEAMQATPWAHQDATPFCWSHQLELWAKGAPYDSASVDWYPDYHVIDGGVAGDIDFACSLTTLNFIVPRYLPMLYAYMLSLGGRTLRRKVSSLMEAVQLATCAGDQESAVQFTAVDHHNKVEKRPAELASPALVVATPGLGARDLLGDKDVLPLRGQTILVRAPWCTAADVMDRMRPSESIADGPKHAGSSSAIKYQYCGISRVKAEPNGTGGFRDTYVIPRGDGTFIVGGTRLPNDWDVQPRPETTEEILQRVVPLVPSLVKPEKRQAAMKSLSQDSQDASQSLSTMVDIIDTNVGLRPARHGGIRIEHASVSEQQRLLHDAGVPLIYSYGYGGTGYQTSWGAAFDTRDLIDDALDRQAAPRGTTWRQLDGMKLRLPDTTWLSENASLVRT